MHNVTERRDFGPDLRITAGSALGTVVAVVLALVSDDGPSRLLFWLVAVVLAGYVLSDLVFRPRLRATGTGLRIRSPLARADLRWDEVDHVRADERSRYGLRTTTLEIDAGELLVVLSRRALGADPAVVQELVLAVAPPGKD